MAFLRGWKPLPKALILAAPIALAVWAFIQFGPATTPSQPPVVQAPPVAVPAESAQATAEAAVAAAVQAASATQATETPALLTPAGGHDAGLDNVLNAGRK